MTNIENISGILPHKYIEAMLKRQEIKAISAIEEGQIQPASIDLRLGDYAYPLDTSFLPGKNFTALDKLKTLDSNFDKFKIDLRSGAVLEKGRIYLIPLQESLALPSDISGFANPKSSTGRLDILTRLIADNASVFDQIEPSYKGNLYIEVAPRSFSVVVKTGDRLNQLRFRKGNIALPGKEQWHDLIDNLHIVSEKQSPEDIATLKFTVDLQGDATPGTIIGYRAKRHASRIDLERRDYISSDFWHPILYNNRESLILEPEEFYILMTKEAVAIPPGYAAEMLAYDTRAGEFRVHYAGFFDPGFGWDLQNNRAGNSRAVLEVRSHDVAFLLEHGQTVGRLRYEKMLEVPQILYGQDIKSNYQGQSLKLAKQFL